MKYQITIEEKLSYKRTMVIDIPNEKDSELDNVLTKVERKSEHINDVALLLEEYIPEIKVIEHPDDSLNSPDDVEIEITEMEEIE